MTPRVALLVIGDGRDALRADALDSFVRHAKGAMVGPIVEVDDRQHHLGFCGAIQEGWQRLRDRRIIAPFDYVFHLEEDWRFLRDFDLSAMCDLLDVRPGLAQVALRRGPENDTERAAGGLVELWPSEYEAKELHTVNARGEKVAHPLLVHRLFFTTNPSVYRESLLDNPWPDGPGCEETFGRSLIDNGRSFAFWGALDDPLWIEHTGKGNRTGKGY